MMNVMDVMSKFRNDLDSIIVDYKDKISDIEKEEEFILTLGDVVNYCKSDSLLLPFYDEEILTSVFERVFPLSNTEINKIKAAKYLIEASKTIDKDHFPQYNECIEDVNKINEKLSKFYEKLLGSNSLKTTKEAYSSKIEKYSSIYDKCDSDGFNSLIDDIDLFEECINLCNLTKEDINILLNVAIKCNLKFLDSNGIVVEDVSDEIADMKKQNDKIQDEISDFSNLLGEE